MKAELAASKSKIETYDAKEDGQSKANSNTKSTCDKTGAKIGQALNPTAQEFVSQDNYKQTTQQQEQEMEVLLMTKHEKTAPPS